MPRKSSSSRKLRSKRKSQSQSQNQTGGADATAPPTNVPQISQNTLEQAGQIAQQFLNKAMSNNGQVGGASHGAELSAAAPAGAAATSTGLQTAMAGGAVAGAVAAAEGYSSLKGYPLVGGGRRGRGRGRKSQQSQQSQQQQQQQQQNQQGGMVPGLLTAVETALVPLGLYLGQKALQSRRSGSRSLGKAFDFRRASRRTRRRR
jgi:hypothetical protein